jgi:amino-acid N-acetyltransferase
MAEGGALAELRPAVDGDLAAVLRLLGEAGLPDAGVTDQFPRAFVVAVAPDGGEVVAAAALERHGDVGLLRSVVVDARRRGAGLGRRLVEERLRAATGLRAVYLLTTTAAPFFVALGFRPVDRGSLPPALAASPEVATACPASAACLVQRRATASQ